MMNKFLSRFRKSQNEETPPDPIPEAALPVAKEMAPAPAAAPSIPTQKFDEEVDAKMISIILSNYQEKPVYTRLRLRIKEMPINQLDEVTQFRLFQRACREDAELNADFKLAGFGDITKLNAIRPTPELGRVVQAFNRFAEETWRYD